MNHISEKHSISSTYKMPLRVIALGEVELPYSSLLPVG